MVLNVSVCCPQIIYAAKSRSTYNVELKKVEETGPFNLAKAFMVSASVISGRLLSCVTVQMIVLHHLRSKLVILNFVESSALDASGPEYTLPCFCQRTGSGSNCADLAVAELIARWSLPRQFL